MTREEAAQFLEEHQYFPCPEYRMTQATNLAIAALREVDMMARELKECRVVMPILMKHERELLAELNKEPDPETGLVPCGCGGKAAVDHLDDAFCETRFGVGCDKCGINTNWMLAPVEARDAWNRAMGYKPQDIAP